MNLGKHKDTEHIFLDDDNDEFDDEFGDELDDGFDNFPTDGKGKKQGQSNSRLGLRSMDHGYHVMRKCVKEHHQESTEEANGFKLIESACLHLQMHFVQCLMVVTGLKCFSFIAVTATREINLSTAIFRGIQMDNMRSIQRIIRGVGCQFNCRDEAVMVNNQARSELHKTTGGVNSN